MSKDDSEDKYHIIFTTELPGEEEFEKDWNPSTESSAALVTTVSSRLGLNLSESDAYGVSQSLDDMSRWEWDRMEVEVNLGILKFKISRRKR